MLNNVPYISTYYIKPVLKPGEDNILNFYVTDHDDKANLNKDDSYRYKIIITRQDKEDIVLYNQKAGDHSVNLGSYDKEGEYEFSIIARDQYGRFSHELFNFIKVEKDRVNNTYTVTEQDLIDYGIKYNSCREIKLLLDCSDIFVEYTESADRIAKMKERTAQAVADYDLPSGHYVVAIPDRDGDGVYQGKHSDGRLYQAVRYADGYDKEAVELECNATRLAIQKLLNDKRAEGYNRLVMYKALYVINANGDAAVKEQGIRVPNGMDLDLNGSTIKLNPFIGSGTIMLYMADCEDTHIHNGVIEGDYFTHDYTNSPNNSEWVNGVDMGGACKYCSIYDLVIKDITGYGLTNGLTQRGELGYTVAYPASAGKLVLKKDIDQTTGEEIEHKYRSTSEMKELFAHSKKWSKYISCSYYLGYQGVKGGTWNIIVHFYDKDKKYIKSINAHQYRRMRVPNNAWYVRFTLLGLSTISTLSYQYFNVPTHCVFRDIKIDNARCVGCAPAQMKDILFENIEFVGCGQCSANCAFDAEDGWDGMQDVTFRNLNFHDNPNNNWLVCAGHNFIIEDSPRITSIYAWGRCRGLVIKNTTAKSIYIENSGILKTFNPRFYNVQSNSWNTPGILRDSKQTITGSILTQVDNCDLMIASTANINAAKLSNSRVTLNNWSGYLNKVAYENVDFYRGNTDSCAKFSFNYSAGDGIKNLPIMDKCRFHDETTFDNHNGFYNGIFTQCAFNDTFSCGVKVITEEELDKYGYYGHSYSSCDFKKIKRFGTLGPFAYSAGKVNMYFLKCNFTFTDDAVDFLYSYATATNGSVVTFKDCTFNNMKDVYIFTTYNSSYDRTNLDITFEFENCKGLPEVLLNPNHKNTLERVKIIIK